MRTLYFLIITVTPKNDKLQILKHFPSKKLCRPSQVSVIFPLSLQSALYNGFPKNGLKMSAGAESTFPIAVCPQTTGLFVLI